MSTRAPSRIKRPPPRPFTVAIDLARASVDHGTVTSSDYFFLRDLADRELRERAARLDILEAVKGGPRRAIFDSVVRSMRRYDASLSAWARGIPWATELRVLQDIAAHRELVQRKAMEARAGAIDLTAHRERSETLH